MTIDSTDLNTAVESLTDQIKRSIGHPDDGGVHGDTQEWQSVTGGLFAIAGAINRLAAAIEEKTGD